MKTQRHPNSLKNLKPAKPGEVRNPLGIKDKLKIKATKILQRRLYEMIILMDKETPAAIDNMLKDAVKDKNPDTKLSMLQAFFGMSSLMGTKKGDYKALDALLNRVLGKPKETVEVTNLGDGPQVIVQLPAKEIDDGDGSSDNQATAGAADKIPNQSS